MSETTGSCSLEMRIPNPKEAGSKRTTLSCGVALFDSGLLSQDRAIRTIQIYGEAGKP